MKVHFIGIGGIGVSALAKYYLAKNNQVSGSDLVSSEITESLKKEGANIFIGKHAENNISEDLDLVIFSPAVSDKNPELKKAKEQRIDCKSYPQALGELTKEFFTIAIAGTHGKSTTTSMLGILLTNAGLDPTVIVGTKVKEFQNSNCRVGSSKYLVIEACEWNASFLNYHPDIIILNNIEKEHLDFFKDLDHIIKTYKQFISNLPENGTLIYNLDDKNISDLVKNLSFNKISFSANQEEFSLLEKNLRISGRHNVYNALAALTAARILKVDDKDSLFTLSSYLGSWRRFDLSEVKLADKKITLINDYAHHPTELKAALSATREKFPDRKIWAVFQPHQYQRTFYLFDDFVKVLSEAKIDELIIADIYDVAGREEEDIRKSVSSEKLASEIKKAVYIPDIEEIFLFLKENMKDKDVLIIMGAGNIYKLADFFPLDI